MDREGRFRSQKVEKAGEERRESEQVQELAMGTLHGPFLAYPSSSEQPLTCPWGKRLLFHLLFKFSVSTSSYLALAPPISYCSGQVPTSALFLTTPNSCGAPSCLQCAVRQSHQPAHLPLPLTFLLRKVSPQLALDILSDSASQKSELGVPPDFPI